MNKQMPFSSMWIKDSLRGKINLHKQDILKINPAFQKFVSNKSFFFIWTFETTYQKGQVIYEIFLNFQILIIVFLQWPQLTWSRHSTSKFDTMKHDLKINQKHLYHIHRIYFTFKRAVLIMSISQWEENLLLKLKRKKQICILKKTTHVLAKNNRI